MRRLCEASRLSRTYATLAAHQGGGGEDCIVVIGGGVLGLSCAYHLANTIHRRRIVVVSYRAVQNKYANCNEHRWKLTKLGVRRLAKALVSSSRQPQVRVQGLDTHALRFPKVRFTVPVGKHYPNAIAQML